jgi:tetratricopeptide (TPR) repeat protein
LIAEALIRRHGRSIDAVSGQVARHFDLAARFDEAITWYQRAAVEAQQRYGYAEAVQLLERAEVLTASLPNDRRLERQLEVLAAIPSPLSSVESFSSPRLAEAQQRAVDIAASLGVEPDEVVLRSMAMSHLCANRFDAAAEIARRLQAAAERAGDENLLIESEYLLGVSTFWAGALDVAQGHFERAVDRYRPDHWHEHIVRFAADPKIVCLSRLGNTLRFLGRPDDARRARDDAIAMADDLGHPPTRSVTYVFAALLALDLDERDRFQEIAAGLQAIDYDAEPNRIKSQAISGCARVFAGDARAGIAQIEQAVARCRPVNPAPGFRSALMRVYGGALHAAGDRAKGLRAADDALALPGTRLWDADHQRLRRDFLADLPLGGMTR